MLKGQVRCKVCGESELVDVLVEYGDGEVVCTTCDNDNIELFINIDEEEEDMEDEVVEVTCIHCGDDFEAETLVEAEKETCPDCAEVLEYATDEDLIIALAEEFGCSVKDIVENGSGEFSIDGIDYLVLTEDEADEKVKEYVAESLWAFSANFLSSVTGVDSEVFEAIQANDRCEGNNDAIESILNATNTTMEEVAEEAVRWDGRGHFLNSYDGQEIELQVNGDWYFCYRY